jgi:hypothetical protein
MECSTLSIEPIADRKVRDAVCSERVSGEVFPAIQGIYRENTFLWSVFALIGTMCPAIYAGFRVKFPTPVIRELIFSNREMI